MAPTRRPNDGGLLARVNFPLYSVEMITSRHCLVAGGGGSAKTGVANGFEIYEIYHNGDRFIAEEIIRHETGSNVVMNCAVTTDDHRSYLVAGQESHCQLYHVNTKIIDEDDGLPVLSSDEPGMISNSMLRQRKNSMKPSGVESIIGGGQRKGSMKPLPASAEDMNSTSTSTTTTTKSSDKKSKSENNYKGIDKKIRFEIKSSDSIQTDFTPIDPWQRVVRISSSGKLMATGGTDGHIRIWKFPQMIKIYDINLHTKEADDLDFSPDSKKLISIAKDGLAIVTSMETGKELVKLNWTPPEGSKYLFKRCRFSVFEGAATSKCRLFTITNPLGKVGKQRGFLQQWNSDTGRLSNIVGIDESLASLAVRDDGRFVAIGTMFTGSVSIYIAFSLQQVLHIPNAHSMFVTGLEFLPLHRKGPAISSDSEAAVLSISIDNKVCIHSLHPRHTIPAWLAVILIVVLLFFTFVFCSYVGL